MWIQSTHHSPCLWYTFPPLCHSLFPSGLCSTELGQWTVWISSGLNPRFPKTRRAATFVSCVCGINYTVISAVRYTTYCYLSTPANQPSITSSAPRHKKLGCLCFKTSDLQSQLHLKKTHSYKHPCGQIGWISSFSKECVTALTSGIILSILARPHPRPAWITAYKSVLGPIQPHIHWVGLTRGSSCSGKAAEVRNWPRTFIKCRD